MRQSCRREGAGSGAAVALLRQAGHRLVWRTCYAERQPAFEGAARALACRCSRRVPP